MIKHLGILLLIFCAFAIINISFDEQIEGRFLKDIIAVSFANVMREITQKSAEYIDILIHILQSDFSNQRFSNGFKKKFINYDNENYSHFEKIIISLKAIYYDVLAFSKYWLLDLLNNIKKILDSKCKIITITNEYYSDLHCVTLSRTSPFIIGDCSYNIKSPIILNDKMNGFVPIFNKHNKTITLYAFNSEHCTGDIISDKKYPINRCITNNIGSNILRVVERE